MTRKFTHAALSMLALILFSGAALAADPGIPIQLATIAPNDQAPGIVLVYNAYTSDAANPATADTRVNITNTNQFSGIAVHLFFLRGTDCNVADSFLCLTENQTATFQMSDLDPGVSGYIIAIASNEAGIPINFPFLIGDAYVRYASGHAANLGAVALLATNFAIGQDGSSGVLTAVSARVLAVDNIPSREDGNDTLLILNRIGGDLTGSIAGIGSVFGIIYNDVETPYSFSFAGGTCQFRNSINSPTPFRLTPPLNAIIPGGRSGWIRLQPTNTLLGAVINRNTTDLGFNGGHNLHVLTLQNIALTVPIIGSNCPSLGLVTPAD
jgi:hypothetical protein